MQKSNHRRSHRPIRTIAPLLLSMLGLFGLLTWLQIDPVANAAPPSQDTRPGSPGLHVLSSDERGIVLELRTPSLQTETVTDDEGVCQAISVEGYTTADRAGRPALPVYGTLAGVPPEADLTLTVLSVDQTAITAEHPPCPAPRLVHAFDRSGQIVGRSAEAARDPIAYAADRAYPATVVDLGGTGFVRSQRVAQLRFHPVRYNPVSGELTHYTRILVRLDFGPSDTWQPPAARLQHEGAFEAVLQHTLPNYETARRWRQPRAAVTDQAPRLHATTPSTPSFRIEIDADAIYQVTYADLEAAGMDVDVVDPQTFRLHNHGQEVAIYVTGEADGSFDPGDVIVFYGEKTDTRYTDLNVYWLTWGNGLGARMTTLDGTPSGTAPVPAHFEVTQRVEENNQYRSQYPIGPDDDRWFWNTLIVTTETIRSYPATVEHVTSTTLNATVRGYFHGHFASPTNNIHTKVRLNGHLVDDATWYARAEYAFEAPIPQPAIVEGNNTIAVEFPFDLGNTFAYLYVNRFEIVYHRTYAAQTPQTFFAGDTAGTWEYQVTGFPTTTIETFDVTSPTLPTRILSATVAGNAPYTLSFQQSISEPQRYVTLEPAERAAPLSITPLTPTGSLSAPFGADYIIISHGDFLTAVQPLADFRASQGLRTVVVDVANVYDVFNHGVFHPEAIRDFLAHAYETWEPPSPTYVLLVGDGNYDFKNYLGTGEPNYIPPYLADVDIWLGEVPADNRYVCVSGDDILPDMHLGRLAVKTPAEVVTIVDKILNYEQTAPIGAWNRQLLFVADDADETGDFAALSNDLIEQHVPAGFVPERVHLGITHPNPWPQEPALLAHRAVTEAINRGPLLVSYIGHGDRQVWASERLLKYSDIASFTNTRQLPFIVPMTCKVGYYVEPSTTSNDRTTIGEGVVHATGGAIASWSPTGDGSPVGHSYLNRGLFQALFRDRVTQLGPATLQGKLELYAVGGSRDLIDTYLLFGDPALDLNVPHINFLPLCFRKA